MVQLLFGLSTDLSTPSSIWDAIRSLLSVFDLVVYKLIGIVYNVLFNISNASIIKSDIVKDFFSRVQLILGIVMIFKISVSLLQYVINPDAFNDKKTGMSQMITRIVVMLAMLTAIVPLNIPISEDDETNKTYNYYLNQHGLLFGTLFSLQNRVLENGVIEKLVLGNSTDENYILENGDETQSLKPSDDRNLGEEIAVYILKVFIDVNKKEGATDEELETGSGYICYDKTSDKLDSIFSDMLSNLKANAILSPILPMGSTSLITFLNTAANAINADTYNYYKIYAGATKVSEIVSLVNVKCGSSYVFAYFPIVSTICGAIVLILFAVSCLDVAIRALKLVILRLIAPIAIISYIDPKSAEKGAFGNWLKLLVSTYIDLFLRLGIIYFVVFLATRITSGGLEFGHGVVGAISDVIIIIGLFYFARQAPKFISDALGIKGFGTGVGLSGVLGAVGALMGGAGLSGAAAGFMDASNQASDAAAQGKQAPSAYSTQRDKVAQMLTGKKDAKGGILGRATGAMQDRANSNMANRVFGLNREKVGQAKDLKYAMASGASDAKDTYDRFIKGNMNSTELNSILDSDRNNFGNMELDTFQDYLASGGYGMSINQNGQRLFTATDAQGNIRQLSQDESNNLIKDYLSKDASDKETLSAKQNAWYEEGAKMLEGMGINETLQEKYSARGRRRARIIGDSAKNLAANGRAQREYKVEHQNRGTGWN